jgi:hypothetical protein
VRARGPAALVLAAIASVAVVGCATVCPTGLITGSLTASGNELVLILDGGGPIERVIWPSGYSVRSIDGRLALTHGGTVVATSGEHAALPGGEITGPGVWTVCGPLGSAFGTPLATAG